MLGHQHLVKALQNLRNEVLADKLEPSEALTWIRATVLRHNTPKPVRQAAAGESQYAQSGVKPIPLSGWAKLLLSPDIQEEPDDVTKLYLSLQRAGYESKGNEASTPSPAYPCACTLCIRHARTCERTPSVHWHRSLARWCPVPPPACPPVPPVPVALLPRVVPVPRPPVPQHTVTSTYGPLQKWVQEQRDNALEALRNLEKGPKTITAGTMRHLRKLLTPAARADIIPALTGPHRPQLQHLEAAIEEATRRQWLDFHWTADNPQVGPDLGVTRLPANRPTQSGGVRVRAASVGLLPVVLRAHSL